MLELSLMGLLLVACIALVINWNTDSDDDDSSGGLLQPALVPVPVRGRRQG